MISLNKAFVFFHSGSDSVSGTRCVVSDNRVFILSLDPVWQMIRQKPRTEEEEEKRGRWNPFFINWRWHITGFSNRISWHLHLSLAYVTQLHVVDSFHMTRSLDRVVHLQEFLTLATSVFWNWMDIEWNWIDIYSHFTGFKVHLFMFVYLW